MRHSAFGNPSITESLLASIRDECIRNWPGQLSDTFRPSNDAGRASSSTDDPSKAVSGPTSPWHFNLSEEHLHCETAERLSAFVKAYDSITQSMQRTPEDEPAVPIIVQWMRAQSNFAALPRLPGNMIYFIDEQKEIRIWDMIYKETLCLEVGNHHSGRPASSSDEDGDYFSPNQDEVEGRSIPGSTQSSPHSDYGSGTPDDVPTQDLDSDMQNYPVDCEKPLDRPPLPIAIPKAGLPGFKNETPRPRLPLPPLKRRRSKTTSTASIQPLTRPVPLKFSSDEENEPTSRRPAPLIFSSDDEENSKLCITASTRPKTDPPTVAPNIDSTARVLNRSRTPIRRMRAGNSTKKGLLCLLLCCVVGALPRKHVHKLKENPYEACCTGIGGAPYGKTHFSIGNDTTRPSLDKRIWLRGRPEFLGISCL